MNEIAKIDKMTKEITEPEKKFKGYTIEEIRYQRALVAMQADFCKTKILKSFSTVQKINPLSPSSVAGSLPKKTGSILLKLLNGLNYVDYAILGYSAFSSLRKVVSLFRRKKK